MENPITEYRQARGWSRREFAVVAGVAYSVVARTEQFDPATIPYKLFRFFVSTEGQARANEMAYAYHEARKIRAHEILTALPVSNQNRRRA